MRLDTNAFLTPVLLKAPLRRRVRELHGLPETLARAGALELKLAVTKKEIRRAQRLRYKVFFEDGGAVADPVSRLKRRDVCPFDRVCDHLLVVDHAARDRLGRSKPRVVGAYRLLRDDAAAGRCGFYSAQEYDLAPLLARHADKRFLELGRSCVLPAYRAKRVIELLWRGVWTYVRHHRIDVMIGCASFPGADASRHAAALAFLRAHAPTPEAWRAAANPAWAAPRCEAPATLDARRALAGLPPLIKAYLRVGARFADEAVLDRAFDTTDVLVVMPVAEIDPRYVEHFGGASEPLAA
ncbi:MAG TPA: GNAT family N-acyltransferase [Beijerinckiaceae bacterium]